MYVRLFCTIMNPPMIVRMYKNKEILKFVETRDGCPSGYTKVETKNRASKLFKLSMTITSPQGNKRMPNFFQTCWIQSLEALAYRLYIEINQPGRFIFKHKPVYII